jgi:ABC-type phosphate transport system permease subunit
VIPNEFGEAAAQPLHKAALIGAGLVLFVLTFIVNAIARLVVARAEREQGEPITPVAPLA